MKLVGLSSECIVDGNKKLTLGLIWSIIMKFQVDRLKGSLSELHQSNLERTLLDWCQQNTKNYPGVEVKNFTTSWSDGLAFNALLHQWHPHLINFEEIAREPVVVCLDHAFEFAQNNLGIERFLDPEGTVIKHEGIIFSKILFMYIYILA